MFGGGLLALVVFVVVVTVGHRTLADDDLRAMPKIFGAEIGAWEANGGPAVEGSTIPGLITLAGIPDIRFAQYDCFTGETCGSDDHAGSETRASLDAAIIGITRTLHAVPWMSLLPVTSSAIGTVPNGSVFCPPWTGDATGNIPMFEAQLQEIATVYKGPIILESSNEMQTDCWQRWKKQGAPVTSGGSVGVSRRLGEVYASTMPVLTAYARALGFSRVVTVGYIGVGGGTNWGQACTPERSATYGYTCTYQSRWINEFNSAIHTAYVVSGNNPDYIPYAESIHAYPHSSDFGTSPGYEFNDNIAFAYYRNWIESSRAQVRKIWGTPHGDNIRFAISEWNAGVAKPSDTWSGWATPSRVQNFYTGWFKMLLGDGRTTGTSTQYWAANCFEVASNSDVGAEAFYNLINQDGSTPAWYTTFVQASERARIRNS